MEASAPPPTASFEQLMLPHLDSAYNLARWILKEPHDAEDAVQEACLRAFRGFGGFRGQDGRAWLLTIVRNVCYTHLRQARREPVEVAFEESVHGAGSDAAEINASDWKELRTEQLDRAMETLRPEFREILVLHDIEGLAYREIATVAGIPMGTVMSRLARAREKLHEALQNPKKEASP